MVFTRPAANAKEMAFDDPPYSRIFIVYNRKDPFSEQDIREEFGQFGEIQDIYIVQDKFSGQPKGIAYIKFSKMSEAAMALEKMNGQPIKNKAGIHKVYMAKNKGEAGGADEDPDRFVRLFVTVPKTADENDIKQHFSKFGDVKSVKLLRNKPTNESKGIGYVTFSKVSEAAMAVETEENEEGYKAVISRPKEKNPHSQDGAHSSTLNQSRSKLADLQSSDFFTAQVSAKVNKESIYRLFDIPPGLRNIEIVSQNFHRLEVVATYNSALSAEYALNKLHGLEYPPGEYITVESKVVATRPNPASGTLYKSYGVPSGVTGSSSRAKRDYRGELRTDPTESIDDMPTHSDSCPENDPKLAAISRALAHVSSLLKSAGLSTEGLSSKTLSHSEPMSRSTFCDFPVPPPQPVLSKEAYDERSGIRLFFVAHPSAPPMEALYDIYCRFGNFAGVLLVGRRNYGYLFFTSVESGNNAIQATDDQVIAGVTMKVLKADPRKRVRTES